MSQEEVSLIKSNNLSLKPTSLSLGHTTREFKRARRGAILRGQPTHVGMLGDDTPVRKTLNESPKAERFHIVLQFGALYIRESPVFSPQRSDLTFPLS